MRPEEKEKVDVSALYCQTKASLAINPTTSEAGSLIFTLEAVFHSSSWPLWKKCLYGGIYWFL